MRLLKFLFSDFMSAVNFLCEFPDAPLKSGDIVVFESTVYPGATEEVCIPEIEKLSGFVYNRDFYAGYSPERINSGGR